jgi:hypothetical protein
MYEEIKQLIESDHSSADKAGLVIQYLDSEMGLDGWLDEDQSPEWDGLPKGEQQRLYSLMLKILNRSF